MSLAADADGSKHTEKRQQAKKQSSDVHKEPLDRRWGFFNWEQYTVPWQVCALELAGHCGPLNSRAPSATAACLLLQVPWGGRETVVGMIAWASTFLGVGLVAAPLLVKAAGLTVCVPWHTAAK